MLLEFSFKNFRSVKDEAVLSMLPVNSYKEHQENVHPCSIPGTGTEKCPKIKYLSVAPMFAEAIERIYQEISISKLFR